MDSCIVYLLVRCLCLGVVYGLQHTRARDLLQELSVNSQLVGSFSCTLIFGWLVFGIGRAQVRNYQSGAYDTNGPPFSGRNRMHNQGKKGNYDISTGGVCIFWAMPCMYMILPSLLHFLCGSAGSVSAAVVLCATLALGWSIRMFERFALDGWWPMNFIKHHSQGSDYVKSWVVVAALMSPTAWLHWHTGITLLFGYIRVRSMDLVLMGG